MHYSTSVKQGQKNSFLPGFSFLLLTALWIGLSGFYHSAQAQVIYQGPAVGTISGGAPVSTGQFKNKPESIVGPQKKIRNPFWDKFNPAPISDALQTIPPAAPAGSNLIFDAAVANSPSVSVPPSVVMEFEGNAQTNSIPPDPILAVGPDHIISMVNSAFNIYDKQGNLLFSRSADSWFQNVLPYSGLFDPIVIYDHFAERWVQCWDLQDDASQTGYWLISVSDDSNPMGNWYNFAFPAHLNGSSNAFNWGDYQKVGYDYQAVYVTGRQFGFTTGFNYCKIRIIPKAELYADNGGPVNYTDFWNLRDPGNISIRIDGPPVVATHWDSTNNIAYAVVDDNHNTSNYVTLWRIHDPLGSPTLSALNIPTTAAPPANNANQLGGGFPRIDVGRRTYRNAFYKDGNIWTACPIGGGAGNAYTFARYIRIDVNTNSILEDAALGADGYYYLYPAAVVDDDNNMVMVFTRSADNEYAGAGYTGRRDSDPPGLAPSVLLKEGEANYVKTFGGSRNRWGDYMGIGLSPDGNVIWSLIEYAKAPSSTWATRVGAFAYRYTLNGIVRDASNSNPLDFASVELVESGRTQVTDTSGEFDMGSPSANVTLNISRFAYQPVSMNLTLTPNTPLNVNVDLQPEVQATISGQVLGLSGGVQADLEFYAEGDPSGGPYVATTTDANGNYSVTAIVGNYTVVVNAVSPYPSNVVFENIVLVPGGLTQDFQLEPADLMLVDDDDGSVHESFYKDALENILATYHHWDIQVDGIPTSADMDAYPSKVVLWYTGDTSGVTLDAAEQAELLAHLNNGGRLLLTGQDIAQDINGSALLNTLGLSYDADAPQPIVRGVAGDIGDGIILITSGGDGAGNQVSKDQMSVTNASTTRTVFYYGASQAAVAGAAYEANGAKAVVFGFGIEGVSEASRRESVLDVVLNYLDVVLGIEEPDEAGPLPSEFTLAQNYPNPFNPSTTIEYTVPRTAKVELTIYNALGQKVRTLASGLHAPGLHRVVWDGRNEFGRNVTSGVYFYRLNAGGQTTGIKKLVLLK